MAPGDRIYKVNLTSGEFQYGCSVFPDGRITTQDQLGNIFAVNPDGSVDWTADVHDMSPGGKSSNTHGMGVYVDDDDAVYWVSRNDTFYKLDAANGSVQASITVSATFDDDAVSIFPAGTLAIGNDNADLYGLDANLNSLWTITLPTNVDTCGVIDSNGNGYWGRQTDLNKVDRLGNLQAQRTDMDNIGGGGRFPAMTQREDKLLYPSGDVGLYCIDPADLSIIWTANVSGSVGQVAIDDTRDTAYMKDGSATLNAINLDDGSVKWTVGDTGSGTVQNGPVLGTNGEIYHIKGDANLYAHNPDGSEKWVYHSGATEGKLYQAPAMDGDRNRIYFSDPDGNFHAVETETTPLYARENALSYPYYFAAVVNNGSGGAATNEVIMLREDLGLRGEGGQGVGSEVVVHDDDLLRGQATVAPGDEVVLVDEDLGQG